MSYNPSLNFDDKDVKRPKLRPLPDINSFQKDKFKDNPLLNFHLEESKRRRVGQEIQRRAKKAKIKCVLTKNADIVNKKNCNSVAPLEALVNLANQRPKHELHSELWRMISTLTGVKLSKKRSEIDTALEKEIKDEFSEILHLLSITEIFQWCPALWFSTQFIDKPYLPGHSERYQNFLLKKRKLERTLMITHPFIRFILVSSTSSSIEKIEIKRDTYESNSISAEDLVLELNSEMVKITRAIQKWHHMLRTELSEKKHMPKGKLKIESFCNCADYLIAEVIQAIIRRYLWRCVDDFEGRTPFRSLEVSIHYTEGSFVTSPSREELAGLLIEFVSKVASEAEGYASVGSMLKIPESRAYIPSRVWEQDFITVFQIMLQKRAFHLYEPVNHFIKETIEDLFVALLGEPMKKKMAELLENDRPYDEYISTIRYLQKLRRKSDVLPFTEFLPGMNVSLHDIHNFMEEKGEEFSCLLRRKVCEVHSREMDEIAAALQDIARRVTAREVDTARRMEQSRYMLHASTVLVPEFRTRVQQLAEMWWQNGELFAGAEMNSSALVWLLRIAPILRAAGVRFEQERFDYEDYLFEFTQSMKSEARLLLSRMKRCSLMDSARYVKNYMEEIRNFMSRYGKIQDTVRWINKEEELLGREPGTFQELDELTRFLVPFAKLVFLVNRWNRTRRAWLISLPEELSYSEVVEKIGRYHTDINEFYNTFIYWIQYQGDDSYDKTFPGSGFDPDITKRPAPVKLCLTALKQIEDLRCHLPLIRILAYPHFRRSHWEDLSAVAGRDLLPNAGSSLEKYLRMELDVHLDEFEVILASASSEVELLGQLSDHLEAIKSVSLQLDDYIKKSSTYALSGDTVGTGSSPTYEDVDETSADDESKSEEIGKDSEEEQKQAQVRSRRRSKLTKWRKDHRVSKRETKYMEKKSFN